MTTTTITTTTGEEDIVKKDEKTVEEDKQLFKDIGEEVDKDYGPTCIESFCVNCEKNGETRLLLTKIPYFKEIIIMSFECPHCGFKSSEVQFGGKFQEKGTRLELVVKSAKDTDRQIVKSESATVIIPELQFEIPHHTQKGEINTIEGTISRAIEGLQEQQSVRKIMEPETAQKIDQFCQELEKCKSGQREFTFIIDDPAGNSTIQNIFAPNPDPNMKITHYTRSREQNQLLGLGLESEFAPNTPTISTAGGVKLTFKDHKEKGSSIISSEEEADNFVNKLGVAHVKDVVEFPEKCYNCATLGELKMAVTDIPHFKEIILMAFTCTKCGYRSNEVKSGGAISEKGKRITLKVTCPEDMTRDVLKSETASIFIPEIELHITQGSMGGKFTTLEGLLTSLKEQLADIHHYDLGDSSIEMDKSKFMGFLKKLESMATGKEKFTFVIDDPVSNSYVQNLYAPDPDPNLIQEDYERSWQQDEDLGLHDIKTEGYEKDEPSNDDASNNEQDVTKKTSEDIAEATTTTSSLSS